MGFEGLPEGCIADILSCTTPTDACRLSLVSKLFYSAAESDALWERFLPSDYRSILSQCMLPDYPSKKALYLALSDHPLILDEGKKVNVVLVYQTFSVALVYQLTVQSVECRASNWRERVGRRFTCLLPDLSPLFGEVLSSIGTGLLNLIPGQLFCFF